MRFLFPIVAFFVFLTGLLYMARNAQPVFFWGYLVAAPALLAALIDIVQRGMSVERLPYLYSGYLYRSVATLFLVLLPLPILFLLGPVGLFSILVMAADLIFGILPDLLRDEPVRPVLCSMAGVGEAACVPALSIYFVVYALLAAAAVKYGTRLYDHLIDLVARVGPL